MNPTQQSLALQLQVDEIEIAHRKRLLGFTADDAAALAHSRPHILGEIDRIVEEFYARQTSVPEIALIIGDAETLRRLSDAQRSYIVDLFSGTYDEAYVNNRLRIGLVHKRIGVEPKYYLAAVKLLRDLVRAALERKMGGHVALPSTLEAFDKLLYLDTQLVFDTYIGSMLSEVDAAKEKALRYAKSLERKVAERTRELERLSRLDALTGLLNQRAFFEDFTREIERAKRNRMVLSLIFLDLNDFKRINDTQGHVRGDELLKNIGDAIGGLVRDVDVAGRYGGDEFCIALPGADRLGAEEFCQRLAKQLLERDGITFSTGVADTGPEEFRDTEEMLRAADEAMYAMKRSIHNRPRKERRAVLPRRWA